MVESYYVEPVTRKELIDNSIKGMIEQLDPHSTYLTPEDYKECRWILPASSAGSVSNQHGPGAPHLRHSH